MRPYRFLWLVILFGLIGTVPAHAASMDYTRAVIHHTASPDVSAKVIDRWHKERGWSSIGYHFVIRADGSVEKGRELWKQGAHAKGRNNYIGIALTGYDKFTPAQINSLRRLILKLKIQRFERHHAQCPGPGLDLENLFSFSKKGKASFYKSEQTATGRSFRNDEFVAASWDYPIGYHLRVWNISNNRSVDVTVCDRGPAKTLVSEGRIIDLSPGAFNQIAPFKQGIIPVLVEVAR